MNAAELLSQLQVILDEKNTVDTDDGWFTSRELAKATDMSVPRASRLIATGVDQGLLDVQRRRRPNRLGETQSIPTYRFKPKKEDATNGS